MTGTVFRWPTSTTTRRPKKTTADIIGQPNHNLLVLSFTQTEGGVRDVKLIRPGYPPDTNQLFSTQYLNSLKPFQALRFMDLLNTNESTPYFKDNPNKIEWSSRRLPTDLDQVALKRKRYTGICWEYVAALGNESGKDIWINISIAASDDYIKQLAELLKANLKPGIHIYIENSNEVWNYGFTQAAYAKGMAQMEVEAGGDSDLSKDGVKDANSLQPRYYARGLVNISKIFRSVYGDDAMMTTIRPVLADFYIMPSHTQGILKWVSDTYGDPTQFFYGVAVAPYMMSDSKADNSTPDKVLENLKAASERNSKQTEADADMAEQYHLPLLGYEGGPSIQGGDQTKITSSIQANRDPGIQSVVEDDLRNQWFAHTKGLYMHYNLCSGYARFGCWGLTEDIQHLDTPKWKAVMDVLGNTDPDIDPALLAHWKLDEGAGTYAVDSSQQVRDNLGTFAARRLGDRDGPAATPLCSTGPDQKVVIDKANAALLDGLDTTQAFTVTFWANPAQGGTVQGILGRPGLELSLDAGNQVQLKFAGASVESVPNAVAPGSWHLVAATYDHGSVAIYVDGRRLRTRRSLPRCCIRRSRSNWVPPPGPDMPERWPMYASISAPSRPMKLAHWPKFAKARFQNENGDCFPIIAA